MVRSIRNTVMVGTFLAVTAGSASWDFLNTYFACILALAASFGAGLWFERAFIKRAHREMTRLHGADWRVGDR
ncbi:branched-subunit amino acid ABC-type transport system permease component [Bradyrhizobium sp. USDA 3311]|nr:hypothetical protein [Bradyrhizobium sp. CCBAU 11361]QHP67986.1 hypothetical protein EI171_12120 [Bradyrhizobium sp. LCT2]